MSKSITLSELVHQVSQLPPLPQAVRAVSLALQRDELSADRCIALIESDLALAARTLRLANSAFYGAPGRVGSIGDAVRMPHLALVLISHAIGGTPSPQRWLRARWPAPRRKTRIRPSWPA